MQRKWIILWWPIVFEHKAVQRNRYANTQDQMHHDIVLGTLYLHCRCTWEETVLLDWSRQIYSAQAESRFASVIHHRRKGHNTLPETFYHALLPSDDPVNFSSSAWFTCFGPKLQRHEHARCMLKQSLLKRSWWLIQMHLHVSWFHYVVNSILQSTLSESISPMGRIRNGSILCVKV